jgi:hypothetical protein
MNLNHVSMNRSFSSSMLVNGNGFVVVAQRSTRPTGLTSRGPSPERSPSPSPSLPTLEKQAWPSRDRQPGRGRCHTTTTLTRLKSIA